MAYKPEIKRNDTLTHTHMDEKLKNTLSVKEDARVHADDFIYVEQQNNPVTEADPRGWESAETN